MRGRIGTKAQIIAELAETANKLLEMDKGKDAVRMLTDALLISCKASALRNWMQEDYADFTEVLEDV